MRLALIFMTLAFVAACDFFAIRCEEDDDCPTDVPFCVDDVCLNEEEAERRGRDVGEGEGEGEGCADDAECPGGLCYDVDDDSGFTGTCFPPADLEDCATDSDVQAPVRDAAGPAIFSPDIQDIGDGCYSVLFSYFDREGDAESGFAELYVSGAAQTQGLSLSGGSAQGTVCGAQFGQRSGLQLIDAASNHSNTLCIDAPQ